MKDLQYFREKEDHQVPLQVPLSSDNPSASSIHRCYPDYCLCLPYVVPFLFTAIYMVAG